MNEKHAPWPGTPSLSTQIFPPCASTTCLAIAAPDRLRRLGQSLKRPGKQPGEKGCGGDAQHRHHHRRQQQLPGDGIHGLPDAPSIEARMDAGFASGDNLTWLLEMGYELNTKHPNARTTEALCAQLPRGASWTRVGDNAEMILIGEHHGRGCPYPLTVALERFKVKNRFKYASLVRYGPPPPLEQWFADYNGRPTIEAGNKEMKGPFFVQHLMSRSPAGMQLQVVLTGLAANAIRWCRPWLQACVAAPTPSVNRILASPKALVRGAANSTALVQCTGQGTSVVFGPHSALPGAAFTLHSVPAVQLPLGFHRPLKIAAESTKPALNAHSLR